MGDWGLKRRIGVKKLIFVVKILEMLQQKASFLGLFVESLQVVIPLDDSFAVAEYIRNIVVLGVN